MKPICCWSCGKMFGDLKHGAIQIVASTNLKDTDLSKTTVIEILCPRCKKMNTIIKT